MKARYAFSMIELLFVIVVMGILASYIIPRIDRDLRQEAMDSIISDIMLTQRIALSDNRHDSINQIWQRRYWQWRITQCRAIGNKVYYSIYSDRDSEGNADRGEAAIDSYNHKYLDAPGYCRSGKIGDDFSKRILLTDKFGIATITRRGGCSGPGKSQIAFDELGRPHSGINSYKEPSFAYLMKEDCYLTFSFENALMNNSEPFVITIEAISGRVYVSK